MQLTRRGALALGAGFAATMLLPFGAAQAAVDEALAAFTGGAAIGEGGITLTTPEIAENGNTVPVTVSAPGAVSIMLLAAGNPNPGVGTFNFGPLAASQSATTRIRLAGTQQVIAVAKMADGSFVRTANEVKVTIGGCGG
ncbi:thiosulfate oxidation carrier protein SoxY [Limibaculum sp. FT325]|uniref:thiosulfate oxidation carrier protein SoxY n=1 Tax=Thermohalobaculum sediminis TaxID=2939436 RepID=UPI0020C0C2E1|nr:thiosulfate oxidation carrier protein SoxY [Limibaculum sediminis]MCL5778659.1 thiosulfate oxidation carrier protein SoxY [Limibaculum sediminis]